MKPPLKWAGKLIDSPFPVSRQNFVYCEFYHVTAVHRHFYFKWSIFKFSWNNFAESFYNLNYGLSIITSKVCQINSVMETERLVFPEKWYFKKVHFSNLIHVLSWKQQRHQFFWYYLTNFWRNNWWSIIDVVERLSFWVHYLKKKDSKT